eukprot:TRINITY_DN4511_c0_g2_i1.p1 TRINITY_DN4511_c0_g2~~TRINITY_DN4511_c0_g2_i1.p1  ORF type:complete len:252 (-),score=54.76 TRINITY_DN4511_c0_g2_i1:130-885(-)
MKRKGGDLASSTEKKSQASGNLHTAIEVRQSPIGGRGLFATKKISKGEVVWEDTASTPAKTVTAEEVLTWAAPKRLQFRRFAYQTGVNSFSAPVNLDDLTEDPAYFMNHSCDPNCWFIGDAIIEANREIQVDEEITYDYATSESYKWPETCQDEKLVEGETLDCHCGSKSCRGKVGPDDWKKEELRKKYHGHFVSYLTALIEEESKTKEKGKENGSEKGKEQGKEGSVKKDESGKKEKDKEPETEKPTAPA